MSDSGKREAAIPVWQRQDTQESAQSTTLLEQARRFLEDESVVSEPPERKRAFLESKGIPEDVVEQLLGTKDEIPSAVGKEEVLRTIHDSNAQNNSSVTSSPSPPSTKAQTTPSTTREIPPIITYPEFLLKPQKPPPLITLDRLLSATYIFAGAAALTYGASKYLVEPMLETLTEARRNMAQTALKDLQTLNIKLETNVSHVPYIATSKKESDGQEHDGDSVVSDPTELFHRDMATQTSPPRSRSDSSASLHSQGGRSKRQDPIADQSERLKSLKTTMSTLLNVPESSQTSLKDSLTSFQVTIDKLENAYNPFRSEYSIYASSSTASNSASKKSQSDEASKFKTEIRSLKGAFLSSRNFPTARPTTYSAPR